MPGKYAGPAAGAVRPGCRLWRAYETARYYIHTAPDQFELGGPPYFKVATGIGMRKDETALNTAFRATLAAMMKDGAYARIFTKWDLQIDMLAPASEKESDPPKP
ncbi:MAG TPA: transporter substrate-binding domain-containing protein [Acetobacteraceae bacterium]|nr:transporter substrate-binding domain-containing protein [Acetobacteraceae bacterium]